MCMEKCPVSFKTQTYIRWYSLYNSTGHLDELRLKGITEHSKLESNWYNIEIHWNNC